MTFHTNTNTNTNTTDFAATASSLAALLSALSDPAAPLSVDLWSDDGLPMARLAITAGGHALEADVAYQAVSADGPISLELPGLTGSCKRALAGAGVIPSSWSEQIEATGQIEMALAQTLGARIEAEILSGLQGRKRDEAAAEEAPSLYTFRSIFAAPDGLRVPDIEVRFADRQGLKRLE